MADWLTEQYKLEELAKALGEPLAVVRNMAFRQKALLGLEAAELKAKIEEVAKIVDVSCGLMWEGRLLVCVAFVCRGLMGKRGKDCSGGPCGDGARGERQVITNLVGQRGIPGSRIARHCSRR